MPLFALVIVVIAVVVGVYLASTPGRGVVPRYAYVAPVDAPFFAELHLPAGALAEGAAGIAESRLLSAVGREQVRDAWAARSRASGVVLAPLLLPEAALAGLRRVVVLPPLSGEPGYVLLYEFAEVSSRDAALAAHEFDRDPGDDLDTLRHLAFEAFEHDGVALLAVAPASVSAEAFAAVVERVVSPPAERHLGTSVDMRMAVGVNREHGLFLYRDPQATWEAGAGFLEVTVPVLHAAPGEEQESHERELLRAVEEVLAPGLRSAGGLWLGLDEGLGVQHRHASPLGESGVFSHAAAAGPWLLDKLPQRVAAFATVALFKESPRATFAQLEEQAPRFWAALTTFAGEAWLLSDAWDDVAELRETVERLGDAATGQVALGLLELDGAPYLAVFVGHKPPMYEDTLAEFRVLARRHGINPRERFARYHERVKLTETGRNAVFLEPDALYVLLPLTPADDVEQDRSQRIFEQYRDALGQGTLGESQAIHEAYRGIDPGATLVVAVQPKRLSRLVEHPRLPRPGVFAEDAWISASAQLHGTVERIRLNVGLRDLAALALLAPQDERR